MSALTTSNPDNANPTVHKTGHEASSRSRYRLADFLDAEEDDDDGNDLLDGGGSNADKDVEMQQDGLTYDGQTESESENENEEPIDSQEIFGAALTAGHADEREEDTDIESLHIDLIRSTTDPEHPLTLEQLAVVSVEQCKVTHGSKPRVFVEFTVGSH